MKFESLELAPALLRAVAAKGYTVATPIQADAIPPILAGRDLVGCAQTGTGKTAAFALPTLERILNSIATAKTASAVREPADKRRKTRCLVLAPTRELASQIAASFAAYGQFTALRRAVIYGGVSQHPQVRALQHGVDVLVATPGRLLDLMNQGHVDLKHVEVLILDEADQMLDMGFIPDLRRIIARVPVKRQTLMFSATMPEPIRKLANEWLVNPASVQTTPIATPAEKVDQSVYFVEKKGKAQLLEAWLQSTPTTRTLVFARTKHGADKIVKHLSRGKIRAAAIHGNKSQGARERVLEQFKGSRPPVLIATDIAARGLDVTGISHVVNFDLPETPETYVHRIGRTGRAGASGSAVSFCSAEEVKNLRMIERLTRRAIEVGQGHGDLTLAAPPAPVDEPRAQRGGRGRRPGGNGGGKPRRTQGARSGGSRPATASGAPATGSGRPAKRRRPMSRL
jgi:ATP-dependent RNA helicase RhlE